MTRHLSRLRSRLTYANTVATLALFAALSTGGAYAASQLGKNSVGAEQIRKGAVASRAIRNHSVAIKDLSTKTRGALGALDRASITQDGSLRSGTARSASRDTSTNGYRVSFRRNVSRCTYAATLHPTTASEPAAGSATIDGVSRDVTVRTYDAAGAPVLSGFDLIVAC